MNKKEARNRVFYDGKELANWKRGESWPDYFKQTEDESLLIYNISGKEYRLVSMIFNDEKDYVQIDWQME